MPSLTDFKPDAPVSYVPMHANGNTEHPDVEHGVVSSVGRKYVFVKFEQSIRLNGVKNATAKACDPDTLVLKKT